MKIFDVAIVGGGPAGAFLAAQMAGREQSALLLEASPADKRKICGEYLCPQGVEILTAAGISVPGRPVRGMRLCSPGGIQVRARFPGGRAGLAVRRDQLDPALLACAREAGAELRRGKRLENFTFAGGRWELTAGGECFSARLLVGADGRQSAVARGLGVQEIVNTKRVALHFFCALAEESSDHGEMHILRGGAYVGISPSGPRELNLSVVCQAEQAKGGAREAAERLLRLSPELAARFLPLTGPVLVAFPISHRVHAVAGPGWALVGDAAGFLDPLTGEGIYQALRSAQVLADCLSEEAAFDAALSRYAGAYRRAFAAKTRVNQAFQALIRRPAACDWVGNALRARPSRAEAFLGVVGNVYSPAQGMRRMLWG